MRDRILSSVDLPAPFLPITPTTTWRDVGRDVRKAQNVWSPAAVDRRRRLP
jgi:hypothetical protein